MNLKELSEKLGLSQTTVSRALNGYPEVNEATRMRVAEFARQHNYSPNKRAKGLATGRSMTIGHVIPTSARHEMVNPVFGDFVAGACEVYGKNGYDMLFSQVGDGDQEDAYIKLRRKGAIDGLIIQGPKVDDERIGILRRIGLPFIVHGRASEVTEPYSWVDVNNMHAFLRATEFLCDLGHTRIALINGLEDMDFAQRRRTGYIEGLQSKGVTPDPALMRSAEMTEVFGHHETRDMLAMENPPTAILVSSLIVAIGVRRAIEEAGLKMGRDISVITHDDDLSYLRNGQDVPIFTATRSSVREAGRIIARMLIDQIQDPDIAPQSLLLEAELVVGRSTGPAPRT
ncbi:MAG: substrate-binding domain-containing protein [Paracoccaceae bacterium]|nr:substrate-binding domain-containing protein [Paracoccaceae bacterium]MDG1738021.1 substrate-binding domain-containing protein [Paracoccaceae bacterium]MDG2259602.1 substrate-binding domain-containing protein [Paracoccaceae bacterium]